MFRRTTLATLFATVAIALFTFNAAAQTGQQLYEQGVAGSNLGGCVNAGCHALNPPADAPLMGQSTPRVLNLVQPSVPSDPSYRVSLLRNWALNNLGMRLVVDSYNDVLTGGRGDEFLLRVINYLGTFVTAVPPPTTSGALQMPSPVGFGVQTVGVTSGAQSTLITNTGGSSVTITSVTLDNAEEFAITTSTCSGTIPAGGQCLLAFTFRPASVGTRSANVTITTNGTGSPQAFLVFGAGQAAAGGSNYTGLYWNSPAGSEDGWGLNVSHQGDTMFVTWFTYDANRKGWWLVMIANKTAEGVYKGDLLETRGPAFNTVPFNPSGNAVTNRRVGSATLDFASTEGPKFEIEIGTQPKITKRITRQLLGTAPIAVCATATGSATAATNYQDLWWAAPARTEDGWGINLTHQGDTIFATWFTYDTDGTPMWLVATAQKTAPGVYSGRLFRTTGTPYNAAAYSGFGFTDVGSLTLTFANGNSATMSYTINGVASTTVTQTKSIIRQVLVEPGTVCQ